MIFSDHFETAPFVLIILSEVEGSAIQRHIVIHFLFMVR